MSEEHPAETILSLSTAYWAARCLHLVADLGIADALGDEPQTAATLASETDANPDALHRVLRALTNHGVFELTDGRFSHNPASRLLRSDDPASMRSLAHDGARFPLGRFSGAWVQFEYGRIGSGQGGSGWTI
jgi:hypothetical protein